MFQSRYSDDHASTTHIMWLTNLAPEIQEAILFLPRVEAGPDTVKETMCGGSLG
ncbi:MAG: hypothetical protein L7U72_15740 [Rubripirellula sp.]|nr:hypothetical protein [Rubripirellula sp.]